MRRYLRTSIHKSKKIVDIIEQPMTCEYLVFLDIIITSSLITVRNLDEIISVAK